MLADLVDPALYPTLAAFGARAEELRRSAPRRRSTALPRRPIDYSRTGIDKGS
jgi:hypothetical protein